MNKNKFGQETKWSLWRYRQDPDYPSTWYFWVDENDVVRFQRNIEPIGFTPSGLVDIVGTNRKSYKVLRKVSNHRMTDEQLSRGELHF